MMSFEEDEVSDSPLPSSADLLLNTMAFTKK